jgi:hypothetical protein
MQSRFLKGMALALITIALPVVAFAQTSRVAGMSIQGDYIKDYTNIFTYPSCVTCFGNIVYGELGIVSGYDDIDGEYFTTEDRALGAVLGNLFDGRYGTFAFAVREYTPGLGIGSQPNYDDYYEGYLDDNYYYGNGFDTYGEQAYDYNFNDHEAFDLMWGKKLGGMSLGLRFNRSYMKYEQTSGGTTVEDLGNGNYGRNVTGLGAGVGFDLNPSTQAEVALLYQSRTYKDEYTGGKYEDDGAGSYLLSGRMMWQWQPNVMVVPVFKYSSFDYSYANKPDVGASTKYEITRKGWQLGVAGNWSINQNDLFVTGITFSSNEWTNQWTGVDQTWTETAMPSLFAALETHVNPWLTIRMGARKGVFYTYKYKDGIASPEYSYKDSYSPLIFNMGAGVKLGTLQFDATMAQDFFHNPASYINSSFNYYSPLFPKVTATYSF